MISVSLMFVSRDVCVTIYDALFVADGIDARRDLLL